jgi:release factor glutamine methyltransferase
MRMDDGQSRALGFAASTTVEAARRGLAAQFQASGLASPSLDARLLVGQALALDHAALVAQAARALTRPELDALAAMARRRLAGEPVARILGVKEFWGLPFRLNAETLVPRPESETLVEAALALEPAPVQGRALRVADLGTGSGALLVAILSERPDASGIGTDVSARALACARVNATTLGCGDRASFVACDYGAALAGEFDLVVSNPPYIARGDIATLAPEVRLFDPWRALDGGPDGLDAYRALASDARRLLAPSGAMVVELGQGQADDVCRLFTSLGLAVGPVHADLLGVGRALVVRPTPCI